jgi:hypothetical protein
VTVPTSLQAVTGAWGPFSEADVYYVYLAMFAVLVIPFCFFDFQKTKYLQLLTIVTRNLALFMMIVLAFITLGQGLGSPIVDVSMVRWQGIPSLFGVLIYSFMCHHSLPSLISPVKDKSWLSVMLAADYCMILFVYTALNYSALLAFSDKNGVDCGQFYPCEILSVYSNSFVSYPIKWIGIFLAVFPVFTLSTNYPLISITLRNNIAQLMTYFGRCCFFLCFLRMCVCGWVVCVDLLVSLFFLVAFAMLLVWFVVAVHGLLPLICLACTLACLRYWSSSLCVEADEKNGQQGHYCGCTVRDRQCALDCGCWDQCAGGRFAWHRIKKYVYAAIAAIPPICTPFAGCLLPAVLLFVTLSPPRRP